VKEVKIEGFRMKIRDIHKLPYGGQEGGRKTESTVENTVGNKHPAVYPEYVIYELIR
jgi:hypothetical protein